MMDEPPRSDAIGAPAASAPTTDARRASAPAPAGVRSTDLEPYTGLRYLSTLFRIMAVILLLVLVAEAVTGLASQGTASLPTVIGEASRLVVLAGILWGTGDLATLLIDIGHDVRATRILLHRQTGQAAIDGAVGEGEATGHADAPVAPALPPGEPCTTVQRAESR
jgi:hypothetical protein